MRRPARPRAALLAALAVALGLHAGRGHAEMGFVLSAPPGAGTATTALAIYPDGNVPLTFLTPPGVEDGTKFRLHVSGFADDAGAAWIVGARDESTPPKSSRPGDRPQTDLELVALHRTLRANLDATGLPAAGTYIGTLVLFDDQGGTTAWPVRLVRPGGAPAVIVLERDTVTLALTRSAFGGIAADRAAPAGDPRSLQGTSAAGLDSVALAIREASGRSAVKCLTVFFEQQGAATDRAELDLGQHVRFALDGAAIDLRGPCNAGDVARRIAPGSGAVLSVGFTNLPAGSYTATLRLVDMGAAPSASSLPDRSKLTLLVHVRDSPAWAVLALIAALAFSFGTTKALDMLRRRAKLLMQISTTRPDWLAMADPTLPVVAARAALRQADELSRRLWLAAPDAIEALIGRADHIVRFLERTRQLRVDIERAGLPVPICQRATKLLLEVQLRVGSDPAQAASAATEAALRVIDGFRQADQLLGSYLPVLSAEIATLLAAVDENAIKDGSARQTVALLTTRLRSSKEVASVSDLLKREAQFMTLKLLWERRAAPEFAELVGIADGINNDAATLSELFDAADAAAWKRIVRQNNDRHLGIEPPKDADLDGVEAYRPYRFRLTTGDDRLDQTHLVRRGLRYEWRFELTRAPGRVRSGTKTQLTPVSSEPFVVQYFPDAGQLVVALTVHYQGEVLQVQLGSNDRWPVAVGPPREFAWARAFETAEVVAVSVAAIVAVASGLLSFYARQPAFGSVSDYLSLFAWAVGVDQAKNAVQILQSYSSPKQ